MPHTAVDGAPRRTSADFYAGHRGGGLYSELVSQRLGSWLALLADRCGLGPTAVTLAGLATGVGASVAWTVLVAAGRDSPALGLALGLAWQLAYALDCADGQLARVTGRSSPAGARLDMLCDVAVQIAVVTAVAATAAATARTPAWLMAAFAGTWMVNLVTSALAAGPAAASLVPSRAPLVRAAKLVRDHGAVVALCGLVVSLWPAATGWLMAGLSLTNGAFLVVSIAVAARASSRSTQRHAALAD